MAFQDIAAQAVRGFAGAAGNQQAANQVGQFQDDREQQKQQKLQMQLAPLHMASVALQGQLAPLIDPQTGKPRPESQARYDEIHDQLADVIGKQRMILNPPPKEDSHGLGHLVHAASDKLHITRHAVDQARQAQQAKIAAYNQQGKDEVAQTVQGVAPSYLNPAETAQAARVKAGIEAKLPVDAKPSLKNFKGPTGDIKLFDANDPSKIPEGYVLAPTGAAANPKPAGPLEAGGVAYGVRGDDGKEYLPDAKGNFPPGTPPEVTQIYATIKAAQKAKEDAAEQKQKDADNRQLRGLAAIADRQGRSEAFQEQMAAYRSAETTHRALDKQARDSEEAAQLYSTTADQPGNKSALDLALVADYTSILAKGGRKTQAEFNLARQIGGLGLRTEAMLDKAQTGELPPEARKMYVDYLKMRAKSEREEADAAKPDLPEIPGGPKTKQLQNQRGKTSLSDRLNDALGK